jgi:hypothetical protein
MREVTESDERAVGVLAWICDECKRETQTLPEYPDDTRRRRDQALGQSVYTDASCDEDDATQFHSAGKYSRDPRLRGIRRKAQRWEDRVAGGYNGLWRYIGLYATLEAAIAARDEALRRSSAG